jgi:hypothetical protein
MTLPVVWPFSSPIVPGAVVPSGTAYVPYEDIILVDHHVDVPTLLSFGFKVASSSGVAPSEITVDLNDLSQTVLAIFAGASA